MTEFILKNILTVLFVMMAPFGGGASVLFLLLYHQYRDQSQRNQGHLQSLLNIRGGLIMTFAQTLIVFFLYGGSCLLSWRALHNDFGLTTVELLSGWGIAVASNIIGGFIGNRVAVGFYKLVRSESDPS